MPAGSRTLRARPLPVVRLRPARHAGAVPRVRGGAAGHLLPKVPVRRKRRTAPVTTFTPSLRFVPAATLLLAILLWSVAGCREPDGGGTAAPPAAAAAAAAAGPPWF